MPKCSNQQCPHDVVSTPMKMIMALLVGPLVVWSSYQPAIEKVLTTPNVQVDQYALVLTTSVPFVLLILVSTIIVAQLPSSNIVETLLTSAGLPATVASLINLAGSGSGPL